MGLAGEIIVVGNVRNALSSNEMAGEVPLNQVVPRLSRPDHTVIVWSGRFLFASHIVTQIEIML